MNVKFYKYQGTGNDFVIVDNREKILSLRENQIAQLCDRRFGIGADGLMLLQKKEAYDFEMVYYNSDGKESTMCGNGGRSMIRFANDLGLIADNCTFIAIDGVHSGIVNADNTISLKMTDVFDIETENGVFILNTGSPHYVLFCKNIAAIDVQKEGAAIRYSDKFKSAGINVNFVEAMNDNTLKIRTYERGVENETLSCGTGTVAAVLAFAAINNWDNSTIKVSAPGGDLWVSFKKNENGFHDIWLCGAAEKVFEGEIKI